MNKRSIINIVKYSRVVYMLYFYIGSGLIRLLGLITSIRPKRIVFSSFGGRKYDDSPRCIFEAMLNDSRFDDYEFIWALGKPEDYVINRARKVKCDSLEYYKVLMSASVWVTNSSMERGLSFKPKNIFNFNTWHGTALKLMGSDIGKDNTSFGSLSKKNHNDIMLAQGQYDVDVFSRVFGVPKDNFRIIGLPRNDELVYYNTLDTRRIIRMKLGIPDDKKVILYAPTFREYNKDAGKNCKMSLPINLNNWVDKLGDNYMLLIRAHYEVVKMMNIEDTGAVKNVSSYPNLNELMIASDMLISDYSSIFFDYSILDKPMLCYAYDYDKYVSHRGLYFDVRNKIQSCCNEEELINLILSLDVDKAIENTRIFKKQYVEVFGNASKLSVDIIWDYLNGRKF